MNRLDVTAYIEKTLELIEVNAKSIAAAQERSGKFLLASSQLSFYLMELDVAISKTTTLEEATWAEAMDRAEGKITEKKIQAQKDGAYVSARETHESLEAQRNWIKAHIRIWDNAHVLFRQLANGG